MTFRSSSNIQKKQEHQDNSVLKSVKKSMVSFYKKEIAFQNLYQQKLNELRNLPQNLLDNPKIAEDEGISPRFVSVQKVPNEDSQDGNDEPFKMSDLNLYKTNHKFNQLISSKIRILNRIKKIKNGDDKHNLTVYRRFRHKDGKVQIDPIRQLALRVIPISRVMQGLTGAGPEQCFVKAVQHATRNDFTYAIEELHKGLSINPNSLHCRFTHGVLMFKLGLLSQAKQDFKSVSEQFPKELSAHFNYALVLLEHGDYHSAIQILKKVTDKSIVTNDLDLLQDANTLQAQCYWRTKHPLEAVKSFQVAQRLKAKMQRRTTEKKGKVEDLQSQLRNWEIRQMKNDIEQDQLKGLQGISKSIKVESSYDLIQRYRKTIVDTKTINISEEKASEFIIDNPNTLREIQTPELISLKGILRHSEPLKLKERNNQNQSKYKFQIKFNQGEVPKLFKQNQIKQISTLQQQSLDIVQSFEENIRSYTCRGSHRDQFMYNLRTEKEVFESQMNQAPSLKLQIQQTSIGHNPHNLSIQNQLSKKSNSPSKLTRQQSDSEVKDFSQQTRNQVNIMKQTIKSSILNLMKEKQKMNDQLFEEKVSKFYKILRDQSLKVIDKNTKMRFDKVFSHLIKSEDMSDNSKLSSKDLHSLLGPEDKDLTDEEVKIILMYQNKLKNFEKEEKQEQKNIVKFDDKINAFTQFMMNQDKEKATVKVRNLTGIDFNPNGVVEINKDQDNLDNIMEELQERLHHVDHVINCEMDKDDHRIFNFNLKNIDLNEFRQNLFDQQKGSVDSNTLQQAKFIRKSDKLIQKLRQSLSKEIHLPYDLCTVLKADLEFKEKQRILEKQQKYSKEKRIDSRKMEMIRREFNFCHGAERNLQILDLILGHLKFFKNLEFEKRQMIYRKARILSVPARTVLFKQDDRGDKMYVILKGRVAVEQHSELTAGVPVVIAMLTDGVHFGELSLLDNTQVESNTKKNLLVREQDKNKFSGRAATCVTAEECDLLVLDNQLCVNIYQPTILIEVQAKKGLEEDESTLGGGSVDGAAAQDFLSRKIRALQGIPYFSDIDPTILKNIAANVSTKTYLYGECILRKGDIPPGLFVILKGQCRIVAQRIAKRKLPDQIDGDAFTGLRALKRDYNKIGIVDNTIFNFNPTTTVLNQCYNSDAAFQNQIIYIDKEGQEIKGEIEYIDFMIFKQIFKGNYFGGRVLVPYEHYSSIKRILFGDQSLEIFYPPGANRKNYDEKGEEYHQMKSLLSVIADSSKVEVWVIDKKLMAYLKEKELKLIYEKIVRDMDVDRLYHEKDIEYITENFKQFDRYKTGLVENFIQTSAMQRYFNPN